MKEEEIIEIIKEFLELREIHSKNSLLTKSYLEVYQEAIQGLLDLYKKEKEKDTHITKEIVEFVNSHYISKDKIREKIESKLKELDKQINEEWEKYGNSKELQDMEDMYNFLQQLFEEE